MSDDEKDQKYVSPRTRTHTAAARATQCTPEKVAPGVITSSHSYEEKTMTVPTD